MKNQEFYLIIILGSLKKSYLSFKSIYRILETPSLIPPFYEDNEGNMMNNRYNNRIRERMNDIDLNDMTIKNEERKFNPRNQRYGENNKTKLRFYNSQLNFPPKEEEEY